MSKSGQHSVGGKNGEKSIDVQVQAKCCRHITLQPLSWRIPGSLRVRQAELSCGSGRRRHVQERKAARRCRHLLKEGRSGCGGCSLRGVSDTPGSSSSNGATVAARVSTPGSGSQTMQRGAAAFLDRHSAGPTPARAARPSRLPVQHGAAAVWIDTLWVHPDVPWCVM
jgi:hypothetical protein